jgi:hypothetical protein
MSQPNQHQFLWFVSLQTDIHEVKVSQISSFLLWLNLRILFNEIRALLLDKYLSNADTLSSVEKYIFK